MGKTIDLLLKVLEKSEGLCMSEYRECKDALEYIGETEALKDKTLYTPDTQEMDSIIKSALHKLGKECKFGVPEKKTLYRREYGGI
tara:strand:- start:361 stop:618 length:258 start_codon:yes stop_codon:yes gene_type:complete